MIAKSTNTLRVFWALLASLLLVGAGGSATAAGVWFKVAGAYNGLAMDDINNSSYSFYDTSINGYGFPDIDGGFGLSLHLGTEISPTVSFGFSWERQHAHVKGTDVDVTAEMKLDADCFMGHAYWVPLQGDKLQAGLAGGMGFAAANGVVNVTRGSASYGRYDTSGTNLAFEAMLVGEFALAGDKGLQLTAGWRAAKIEKVKLAGRTATKEDGSDLALDYSGYTLRLGLIWHFGGGEG